MVARREIYVVLPRAVGSEQAEDGAALDLQARSAQRGRLAATQPSAAERLGEVVGLHGEGRNGHDRLIVPRGRERSGRRGRVCPVRIDLIEPLRGADGEPGNLAV